MVNAINNQPSVNKPSLGGKFVNWARNTASGRMFLTGANGSLATTAIIGAVALLALGIYAAVAAGLVIATGGAAAPFVAVPAIAVGAKAITTAAIVIAITEVAAYFLGSAVALTIGVSAAKNAKANYNEMLKLAEKEKA